MSEKPHASNLRKGRISLPGVCYFITTDVDDKSIPIPFAAGAELCIDCLRWLRDNGRVWRAGYAIMDDHVHFMIVLRGEHTLNPVRRGRVERPEDYAYSTAHPSRAGEIDWEALGYA